MAQRDLLLPWAGAADNAALALRVAGVDRAAARERAGALLRDFGLEGFERARPYELSGGMRQRVAFARTLLSGRTVLCLDEPFASLDALTRQDMQDWLAGALATQPRTVVLVTHDVEEAIVLADRVYVLSPRPGRIVATLDVDVPRPRKRTDPPSSPCASARSGAARMIAAVLVLLLLAGWEAYTRLGGIDEIVLPAPTRSSPRSTRTARCCGATSP